MTIAYGGMRIISRHWRLFLPGSRLSPRQRLRYAAGWLPWIGDALGLVFAIEGLVFAAFPAAVKRAMAHAQETPDARLRLIGIVSALLGIMLIWLVRGLS